MSVLFFSKRKALAACYEKWIDENPQIQSCSESVIAFLYSNDLLNVENIKAFLKKGGEEECQR